jgi:hypothetical protein
MTNHAPEAFDNSLKKIRIFQAVAIASIPLSAYAGEVLGGEKTNGITTIGFFLLALVIYDIWSTFSWRRRRLQKAIQSVASNPNDAGAVKRWHHASIVLLFGCESIAISGCFLRVWGGGTLLQAVPLYACGLILLLVFTPRRLSDQARAHASENAP